MTEPLAPPPSPPELLAEGIEALAREASARDDVREAMALALEWPEEAPAPRKPWAMPRWTGWLGLAGAIALVIAAAVAVFRPEPGAPGAASKPRAEGLRLERQLALPPRP